MHEEFALSNHAWTRVSPHKQVKEPNRTDLSLFSQECCARRQQLKKSKTSLLQKMLDARAVRPLAISADGCVPPDGEWFTKNLCDASAAHGEVHMTNLYIMQRPQADMLNELVAFRRTR